MLAAIASWGLLGLALVHLAPWAWALHQDSLRVRRLDVERPARPSQGPPKPASTSRFEPPLTAPAAEAQIRRPGAQGEQAFYCRRCRAWDCQHRSEWQRPAFAQLLWTRFGPRWTAVYGYRQVLYLESGRRRWARALRLEVRFRVRVLHAAYDRIGAEIVLLDLVLEPEGGPQLHLKALPARWARTHALLYRDGRVELERQLYLFITDSEHAPKLLSAPAGWGWTLSPEPEEPYWDLIGHVDLKTGALTWGARGPKSTRRARLFIPLIPEDLFWALGPQLASWIHEGTGIWEYGPWRFSAHQAQDQSLRLQLSPRQQDEPAQGQMRLSWDPAHQDLARLEGFWEVSLRDSLRLRRQVELRRIED